MDTRQAISQLKSNRATFEALLRDVPSDMQYWRPHAGHWCLLEIVCHLFDEEREDFGARVRSVLEAPSQTPPPIDPQGWVEARGYMQQDYATALDGFLARREASILWLDGLNDPPWDNAYEHPEYGPMSARMFLANWLAHDYLHIRQITKVKYLYLKETTDVSFEYAGGW